MDLTIGELAEAVAEATGFRGTIQWDTSKPDGTPKKQLEVSRLASIVGAQEFLCRRVCLGQLRYSVSS